MYTLVELNNRSECVDISVGETSDVRRGETKDNMFCDIPCDCHHVRHLVALCADRQNHGGGRTGGIRLAVLDQADRGRHRLHWRPRFHVRPVQNVCQTLS